MRQVTALIGLLASLTVAAPVYARSCQSPFWFGVLPEKASQAPRNTRVWILASAPGSTFYPSMTYDWLNAEGERVPFGVVSIPVQDTMSLLVLTPDAPLDVPASYRIEACQSGRVRQCEVITEFSTFDSIDEDAPALPEATERETIEEGVTEFSIRGDTLVVADIDGAGGESPFDEGARLAHLANRGTMRFGEGVCTPKVFEGRHAQVRFGTFDLAGNFSGFTEPVRVEAPEPEGCALSRTAGRPWLLLVFAALLLRRRATLARSYT